MSVSFNWRHLNSLTNANNSGDPDIGGTAARAQTTFTGIGAVDYSDLSMNVNVAKRMTLRIAANNLLDKVPPILANVRDLTGLFYNTIPSRYDALGRQIAVGTTISF